MTAHTRLRGANDLEGRGIMQRRDIFERLDPLNHLVGDALGCVEVVASMHNPMANTINLAQVPDAMVNGAPALNPPEQ